MSATGSTRHGKRKSDTENELPKAKKTEIKSLDDEAGDKKRTPLDAFQKKLDDFMEDKGYLGSMLVKGLKKENENSDDDDEEEEEENIDTTKITEGQIENLRYIMITDSREKDLDEMEKLVLGDQYGDTMVKMFNTRFSQEIMESWYVVSDKLRRMRKPAQKFDLLLAYTFWLKEYNYWMHDNEGGMEVLTKRLASAWKKLLNNSDDVLEIDAEYTRPAVIELLEQFKKEVESVEYGFYPQLKFKYM